MTFYYYKTDGSKKELKIQIGQQWAKQQTNNKLLNSLFSMVDNGDGIVQEREFIVLNKLLAKADKYIKNSAKNSIVDSNELFALINNIKNKNVDLENLKNESLLSINPDDYNIENLKKRYDNNKYEFVEHLGDILIIDKITNRQVLEVSKRNDRTHIVFSKDSSSGIKKCYDKNGAILYEYDVYPTMFGMESKDIDSAKMKIPIADILYKDISEKTLGIMPTTGKKFESHAMLISEENVLEIMHYYKQTYGEDLLEAIDSEYGLYLTSEKRKMKTGIINHIKECIHKAYGYQTNCKKITKVDSKYHKGDEYSTVFTKDNVTIKNLKTGKTKIINFDDLLSSFDYKQRIDIISYLQSISGEALMDVAVECDFFYNGQDFWGKLVNNKETLETADGVYDSEIDNITLAIGENSATVFDRYRASYALLHEVGHSIDYVSSKDTFMTDLVRNFQLVFEKEMKEFKAKGYTQFSDITYAQDGSAEVYYTANMQEMFADCYTFLMTGRLSHGHDVKKLEEHFSGCIVAAEKLLTYIRTMPDEDRHSG